MNIRKLSVWSARNTTLGISGLVLTEAGRFAIGLLLGSYFIPDFAAGLMAILIALLILFIQIRYEQVTRYSVKLKANLSIFTLSFLLSICLGNTLKQNKAEFGVRATETKPTVNIDSLQHVAHAKKEGTTTTKEPNYARAWAVLLFFLGLILTWASAGLACSLACSGNAVAAILVLLMGTGFLSAGIYFLIRALRKGKLKRFKEMGKEERFNEWKSWLKTWLTTLLAIGLFYLILAFVNG